jgi:hypothetical protein
VRGDGLDHLGWAAANLVFPFLCPIVLIKFLRVILSPQHPSLRKRLRLTYLLRDGQYALTSLAVSTASFYELFDSDIALRHGKVWLVFLGILAAVSLIFVIVGLLDETEDPETAIPPGTGILNLVTIKKWVSTYRVGAATLVLVIPVSVSAYNVHLIAVAASAASKSFAHPADRPESASNLGRRP